MSLELFEHAADDMPESQLSEAGKDRWFVTNCLIIIEAELKRIEGRIDKLEKESKKWVEN